MQGPAGKYPSLQIHPTRRCNLQCLHCYSQSGPNASEQLDIEVIRRVVPDAAALGYQVMSVSGGEPLLYPHLPELLKLARSVGLVTTVTTNGMLLDERHLEWLKPDCNLVAISLDGEPESHNLMRASPRAFVDMSTKLEGLRASGIPFGFIFTLTFHNAHELDWVARFAVEQGASLLQLHPLEPVGRATETLTDSIPDGEENAAGLIEALRIKELYADKIVVQIDLATIPALLEHPTRVFVREASLCLDQMVADVVAPLVIETSGRVSPLQYGFPKDWSWGNLNQAPLPDLAADWISRDYAAFLALCKSVYDELVANEEEPALNWYQHIHAAAARYSPNQVRSSWLQPPMGQAAGFCRT
ncbi:MAG: radical SAM protein [Acidobacteria bacterium]|nr:radical SAM protein [Acidobacteriota bacterium]